MDKEAAKATIDQVVGDAAAAAHDDEAHKVERLYSHADTMKMLLDDIHGAPDLVREYKQTGSGVKEFVLVARGPAEGEVYDPAKHDKRPGATVAAASEGENA